MLTCEMPWSRIHPDEVMWRVGRGMKAPLIHHMNTSREVKVQRETKRDRQRERERRESEKERERESLSVSYVYVCMFRRSCSAAGLTRRLTVPLSPISTLSCRRCRRNVWIGVPRSQLSEATRVSSDSSFIVYMDCRCSVDFD